MQTTVTKNVKDYLSLTQYLIARGALRSETGTSFDRFLQTATRDEMRLIITTFSSSLELCLNDSVKRKGTWALAPTQRAIDVAQSYGTYTDYVKGMTENTVSANVGVAIQASYLRKESYVVKYDLAKLETRYEVGSKTMTFNEIIANITEVAKMARTPIRIVETKPSSRLVAGVEGMTATELEQGEYDTQRVKGIETIELGKKIADGTLGMTPIELTNSMSAVDNGIKCKVDGLLVNMDMKSTTFHRGVDVHEILPNGHVKVQVLKNLRLDPNIDDRQRKLFTEDVLFNGNDKVDHTYFNFSWISTWQNERDDFDLDCLSTWMPVLIPGCGELCIMRIKAKIGLWSNSNTMLALVRNARRMHYLWCLIRGLNEQVSVYDVVEVVCAKMNFPYVKALKVMFSLFKQSIDIEVQVSNLQKTIADIVVGIVQKLHSALEEDRDVFDKLDESVVDGGTTNMARSIQFDMKPDEFYGKESTEGKKSITSRLRGNGTIKNDEAIRNEMKMYQESQERMSKMAQQNSQHYGSPTLLATHSLVNPPSQVTVDRDLDGQVKKFNDGGHTKEPVVNNVYETQNESSRELRNDKDLAPEIVKQHRIDMGFDQGGYNMLDRKVRPSDKLVEHQDSESNMVSNRNLFESPRKSRVEEEKIDDDPFGLSSTWKAFEEM